MDNIPVVKFPEIEKQPAVSVCLFRETNSVDICFDHHNYTIKDGNGNLLVNTNLKDNHWRIKLKECTSSVYSYYLILEKSADRNIINGRFEDLKNKTPMIKIMESGGSVYYADRFITNNHKYFLAAGPFDTHQEARYFCENLGHLNHCHIHRKLEKKGSGTLEIFDLSNDFYAEIQDGLELIPGDYENYFQLKHIEIPVCGEEEKNVYGDLFYRGGLKISVGENHSLNGVNKIPFELYLRGAVLSEIGEQNSGEFIKAMAIVLRSKILAEFGQQHFNEEFDLCSSGHCARYYGIKPATEKVEKIISHTKGILLENGDNSVKQANYSFSCGGHTDTFESDDYHSREGSAKGKFDCYNPVSYNYDLTDEQDVKKWIYAQPDVFCRETAEGSMIAPNISSNSFRWEVFYSRSELEGILEKKTGVNPGIIYEIIPVQRSLSGRIRIIEILGSLKNLRIEGELNIRSAFSPQLLQSSCFIVKHDVGEDSVPVSFTFVGAGNGTGNGLCKVGAAKMAADNKKADDILNHYFNNTYIQRKY